MTKYAKAILEIVNSSGEHLTAEQIYLKLKQTHPRVVQATVYNNLHQLHAEERIRKVSVEGYPDRYDKTVRHDHLVCSRCGALADITLEDLTARLQAQLEEEILSYDLKVRYICRRCKAREGAAAPDGA